MKRYALALLLLVAACGTTNPPGPPLASHNVAWWPYNAAAAIASPPAGVSTVLLDGLTNTAANVAKVHAAGRKAITGIGGTTLPAQAMTFATQFGAAHFDFLYIDEPTAGSVAIWIPVMAAFKQANPAGLFGICQDTAAFHNGVIAAGLAEDFACLETYSGDTAADVSAIKAAHPTTKIMMLSYGKAQTCVNWNNPQIDYFGFWDVDNYPGWLSGSADSSWPAEALALAAGGGC